MLNLVTLTGVIDVKLVRSNNSTSSSIFISVLTFEKVSAAGQVSRDCHIRLPRADLCQTK